MSPDIFLVFKFSFSLSGTFFAVRMFNMSYISNHMMTDTSLSTMNMAQLDSKLRKAFALLYVVCGYCNGKCSEEETVSVRKEETVSVRKEETVNENRISCFLFYSFLHQ